MGPRILLGQLGARGDCLYATAVARQIKADYPGCHLTWAVGTPSRPIVEGHPNVDSIWEVPLGGHADMERVWPEFERDARRRTREGAFDEAFFTQIFPGNLGNFDGTVRASIFRGYPRPIRVPVTPVVRLARDEIENARRFAERHGLADFARVILFEYSSRSGQSFVTPELAQAVARQVVERLPGTAIVCSSEAPLRGCAPGILDASALTFKENAALMPRCSLLLGCSSGISWLSTIHDPPLPTVQLLERDTSVFASFVHDHERHGLPTAHVIEMTNCRAERIADCVVAVFERGFADARARFHERIPLRFGLYGKLLKRMLAEGDVRAARRSVRITLARYGPHPSLLLALITSARGYARYATRR